MSSIPPRFDRPPFCVVAEMDAASAAHDIVAAFAYFESQPKPLRTALSCAMETIGLDGTDPLVRAAHAVVTEMEKGIGVGKDNAYHNASHFCEVMLCTLFIAQLARLSQREQAQVVIAALLHDFHHDGRGNGDHPFRLELLACVRADAYLDHAKVTVDEQARLRTLILSTEMTLGVPMARACYARHFLGAVQPSAQQLLAEAGGLPRPEMSALAIDARLCLQAVVLAEGDLLPSFGLTVEYADLSEARLASEICLPLGPQNKIAFIDELIGDFVVATFFSPNLKKIRQTNLDRIEAMDPMNRFE